MFLGSGSMENRMRAFMTAAVALAILTTPAYSQGTSSKGGQGQQQSKEEPLRPGEQPKPVVDEKKYKSAVEVMGDSTQKFDPWGSVREAPKPKSK
jgi:hypothetical protein